MSPTSEPNRHLRYQHALPDRAKLAKAWKLLHEYSSIPQDEIESHVRRIRDRAYSIFPYPCLGRFRFLDLYITAHPLYPEILSRARGEGAVVLDLGCCVAQTLRQLVFEGGIPSENLIGMDLRKDFVELGFELFGDRERWRGEFVVGDILDEGDGCVRGLEGRVDVVHAASFFHLFGWHDQVAVGVRIVSFFRKKAKNPLVLGRQVGEENPWELEEYKALGDKNARYHHNEESMQRLWDVIGDRTGTRWRVEAEMGKEGDVLENGEEVERTTIRYAVRATAGFDSVV